MDPDVVLPARGDAPVDGAHDVLGAKLAARVERAQSREVEAPSQLIPGHMVVSVSVGGTAYAINPARRQSTVVAAALACTYSRQ